MNLPKDKENLITKLKAFESFMYSDKDLFENAIVDYEESFGRPDLLYSEKLARDGNYDHTLLQFADAMGFIHGDTLSGIDSIMTYTRPLLPEHMKKISMLRELNHLEIEVIRAVCDYRIAHPERIGRGE